MAVAVHVHGNDPVIVISPNVDDGHRRLSWSPIWSLIERVTVRREPTLYWV